MTTIEAMRKVLGLTAVLVLLLATPHASASPPPDQPLPGYTIDNPPLPPATVGGQPSRVLQGVHRHAAYTIEVPPRWNGRLAMWAHGYRGASTVLTVDPPGYGLRQKLLDQGFAWAASSYYANNYDVKAGVESTHDLAREFAKLVDKPKDVFLLGVSMGGHVTGRSLEQYPHFYKGALPMCGVLGDHELFDFFLDYQVVAQALAGIDAYPLPDDYLSAVVPRIKDALGLNGTPNDLGKQFAQVVINRSGGPRPGAEAAFAFWKDFLFQLSATSTGDGLSTNPSQLATNVLTHYAPNSPVDLNQKTERVLPENPKARLTPKLTEVPRIAGRPTAPVLSLHNLGDLFVPFSMEQQYRRDVRLHGKGDALVQRAIRAVNHCEFSPAEAGRAWDDLVAWVDTGKRPDGDVVDDPAVVAAPTYGCRFTDPTAYGTGSRKLFAAC
ncbi:alpha/beta hydrolase [Saccharothrix mutabilis subsp. mutabilis]|uniref:Alpha/beta hydrolase n=2 Tax=Saccharothrix mutabilis TaxID=33921 RepID=A0ABN0TSG2_9PSEU